MERDKKSKTKRNVGIQTIIQPKEYLIPKVAVTHNLEIDEYPKIVAIPHSILALTRHIKSNRNRNYFVAMPG